jgi:hypothetical protein
MNAEIMEIAGVIILEPLTSLTDFTTGLTGIFLATLLWKRKPTQKSEWYFFLYFLFIGIATVLAGTLGHGFLHYLPYEAKMFGWSFSAISLMFFELASFYYFKHKLKPTQFNVLRWIAIVQIIAFFTMQVIPATRGFKLVQLNATFCYIVILIPIYIIAILHWKMTWVYPVVLSIVFAGAIAAVYNNQVSYNAWFNHHVITHLMMTFFVIFMYYSVLFLQNKASSLT